MNYLFGEGVNVYRLAMTIFLLFHIGLIVELLLIGHYESFWQYFPLITLVLSLLSQLFKAMSLQIVKIFFLLTIFAGVLGVILHLKNNWEFELEMYPGMDWTDLLFNSFSGALPALAPGTLIPIGMMGFLLLQLKSKNESK